MGNQVGLRQSPAVGQTPAVVVSSTNQCFVHRGFGRSSGYLATAAVSAFGCERSWLFGLDAIPSTRDYREHGRGIRASPCGRASLQPRPHWQSASSRTLSEAAATPLAVPGKAASEPRSPRTTARLRPMPLACPRDHRGNHQRRRCQRHPTPRCGACADSHCAGGGDPTPFAGAGPLLGYNADQKARSDSRIVEKKVSSATANGGGGGGAWPWPHPGLRNTRFRNVPVHLSEMG